MNYLRLLDDSGQSKVKVIFWGLVIYSVCYAFYKFAPMYFNYQMFVYEVRNEAKVAHLYTDIEVMQHVLEKSREWDIPLEDYNVQVVRRTRVIDIYASYEVTLNFFDKREKTFKFDIAVREKLKQRGG